MQLGLHLLPFISIFNDTLRRRVTLSSSLYTFTMPSLVKISLLVVVGAAVSSVNVVAGPISGQITDAAPVHLPVVGRAITPPSPPSPPSPPAAPAAPALPAAPARPALPVALPFGSRSENGARSETDDDEEGLPANQTRSLTARDLPSPVSCIVKNIDLCPLVKSIADLTDLKSYEKQCPPQLGNVEECAQTLRKCSAAMNQAGLFGLESIDTTSNPVTVPDPATQPQPVTAASQPQPVPATQPQPVTEQGSPIVVPAGNSPVFVPSSSFTNGDSLRTNNHLSGDFDASLAGITSLPGLSSGPSFVPGTQSPNPVTFVPNPSTLTPPTGHQPIPLTRVQGMDTSSNVGQVSIKGTTSLVTNVLSGVESCECDQ